MFRLKEALQVVCLQIGVVGVTWVDIPSPGEHIDLLGESARSMVDVKVEGAEEFGPTSLSAVEVSLFEKVLKVFVVGKDLDAMAGAFQVVAPVLEGLDDGEHATTARHPEHQSHLARDTKTRSVALYGQRNMFEECRCSVEAPRVGRPITARWVGRAGAGAIEMNRVCLSTQIHRGVSTARAIAIFRRDDRGRKRERSFE